MWHKLSFSHGVHPPEHKDQSSGVPIRRMPFPDEIVLPLRQHAGKPARLLVEVGDRVERGDKIAEADGFVSVPIHASAAGEVVGIGWWPHPDGSMAEAVRIKVEKFSPQIPRPRVIPRWEGLDPKDVVAAVQKGGVVGLGGAAFPTHVKLLPPKDVPIEVLLINGAECEPFLTTDHRTMVEYPDRVWFGVRIMMKALGVGRAVVGIENNKPDAIEILSKTKPEDLNAEVQGLYVKYPQGAEKMLIKAVTGREVPSGKLPMHVGAVVQNVGTIACIAEIFETGLPLIERVVTVTGPGVNKPQNLIVPVGAKFKDILAFCGGIKENVTEILSGGPMMGAAQPDLDAPATKGVTGIVVLTEKESRARTVYNCISCGHCLDACPMFLNPSLMGKLAQTAKYQEMTEKANLWDCMLCGACSYVCPSNIPLSQMFGMAKYQLGRLRRKEDAA